MFTVTPLDAATIVDLATNPSSVGTQEEIS
jgi:hypothetical protein